MNSLYSGISTGKFYDDINDENKNTFGYNIGVNSYALFEGYGILLNVFGGFTLVEEIGLELGIGITF